MELNFNNPLRNLSDHDLPFLWRASEWYLDVANKGYRVSAVNGKQITVCENVKNKSWLTTTLKIISYVNIILPLIACLIKYCYRKQYNFNVDSSEIEAASKKTHDSGIQPSGQQFQKIPSGLLTIDLPHQPAQRSIQQEPQEKEKANPQLDSASLEAAKTDRLLRFKQVFTDNCDLKLFRDQIPISSLVSILNEGSVDFNELFFNLDKGQYSYEPSKRGVSLLAYVIRRCTIRLEDDGDRVLTLLLKKGLKVNMQDHHEVETILFFFDPIIRPYNNYKETFQLFLRAGFDPTFILPEKMWDRMRMEDRCFQIHALRSDINLKVMLAYHGFFDVNDHNSIRDKNSFFGFSDSDFEIAIRLREQMLDKLQSHVPPKERKKSNELSADERIQLAELCYKTQAQRDSLQNGKGDKELHERVEIHKKFKQACLDGKFEQAKKLLSHDIDIDGLTVEVENKKNFPLVNFACMTGNTKLLKFLIDNGAHLNIGDDTSRRSWLPPILDSAIYPIPNKKEIITLLVKAKADPNERLGEVVWSRYLLDRLSKITKTNDRLTVFKNLLLAGFDINLNIGRIDSQYSLLDSSISRIEALDTNAQTEGAELSKLLIYLSITMRDDLKNTLRNLSTSLYPKYSTELYASVSSAKERYDRVYSLWLKEKLAKEPSLKKLSTDLINIIGDMTEEIELTPDQRIEIAEKCRSD
jgi:hypothetical protein